MNPTTKRNKGLLNRWKDHTPLRVGLVCHHCRETYSVIPQRAKKSKFCSVPCRVAYSKRAPRKVVACKRCGTEFETIKDHGVWPQYCSRECFHKEHVHAIEKECPSCGSLFTATKRSNSSADDGRHIYCSVKCANDGLKNGALNKCANCGKEYYLNKAQQRQRPNDGCCSNSCAKNFYVGPKNHGWKGGEYIDCLGKKIKLFPRSDRVSRYVPEHRVTAMKTIGRLLDRAETVIRINNIQADNQPSNLFICTTYGEFRKRVQGVLPWPRKSNLRTYR